MTQSTQNNITSMVSTEESPSYKRKRMKEVRSMVAHAVKQNVRVDLMDFEGTDIARSQIALQDLLSKSQERHRQATNHVENSAHMNMMYQLLFDEMTFNTLTQQARIAELAQALKTEREDHIETAMILNNKFDALQDAEDTIESIKTTFKVLNG